MAFITQYQSPTGDTYPNAYYEVALITLNYLTNTANITVNVYTSKENKIANKEPITTYNYEVNDNSNPSFTSLYSSSSVTPTPPLQEGVQTIPDLVPVDTTTDPLASSQSFLSNQLDFKGAITTDNL